MIRVSVSTLQRAYDVVVDEGLLARGCRELESTCGGRRAVVVSDENVAPLYLERLVALLRSVRCDATEVVLPAGEAQKTLARAEELYGVLYERRLTRADVLVALGGGVIGDLTGFVAATYLRGLRLVQVPTTLLAQVDAAVGGKVAVDFRGGKNHVGTFYQPWLVMADTATLQSLPDRERRSGAAEVVKYALLAGEDLLTEVEAAVLDSGDGAAALCTPSLVARCLRVKAGIVAADEREERGERQVLNLGHTVGHAIEAAGGFARYSHGEAVALGLRAALRLSAALTGLSQADVTRATALLDALALPRAYSGSAPDEVLALVARDKKAVGATVPFVLLQAVGRPVRGVEVPHDELREVVTWLHGQ